MITVTVKNDEGLAYSASLDFAKDFPDTTVSDQRRFVGRAGQILYRTLMTAFDPPPGPAPTIEQYFAHRRSGR